MICFYVSKFDLYELEEKKGSKRQIFLDAMRLFFTFRIIFHASNSSCDAPRLLFSTLNFLGVSCSCSFTFHLLPLIESQAAHLRETPMKLSAHPRGPAARIPKSQLSPRLSASFQNQY